MVGWTIILGGVVLIAALIHFLEMTLLVTALRRDHPDTWRRLGSPNLWASSGQYAFLKYVFGRNTDVEYPSGAVRRGCLRLRWYHAVLLAAFVPLSLLITFIRQG